MAAIPLPPWLPLLQSHISDSDPLTNYAQLATLTTEGRPSVRTVVVREASAAGLKICTDMRSAKIEGLRRCEWAELCWYFTNPRIQFRITGTLHISGGNDDNNNMVQDMWNTLSSNAKRSFFAPAPGSRRDKEEQIKNDNDNNNRSIDLYEMPDSFALLMLKPTKVDLVDLRKAERRIWEHKDTLHPWNVAEVYP